MYLLAVNLDKMLKVDAVTCADKARKKLEAARCFSLFMRNVSLEEITAIKEFLAERRARELIVADKQTEKKP